VTRRAPRKTTGLELTQPCSLPAAISEPEKVTGPTMTSRTVAIITRLERPAPPARRTKPPTATRAAAPPPTALKMLTTCGTSVILTRRAMTSPAAAPPAPPTDSTIHPVVVIVASWMMLVSAAATATIMPSQDSRLPLRAVAGEFIRCRATTKPAAATRYARSTAMVTEFMTAPSSRRGRAARAAYGTSAASGR
jgi:hypothetical protein